MDTLFNFIKRSRKYDFTMILIGFILLNLFTKFWNITDLQLFGDEGFSVFHSQQGLGHIIAITSNEANPPLYYFILHFWIKIGGLNPIWLKSLGIIIHTISLVFLLLIIRPFKSNIALMSIGVLYIFSNLHFDFSHELRAYQLVLMWCSISFYLWLKYILNPENKLLVILALVNVCIPLSHYNAVLMVFLQALLGLMFVNKKHWKSLVLCYVSSALMFSPQLWSLIKNVPDGSFWLAIPTWMDLEYVLRELSGFRDFSWLVYTVIIVTGIFLLWKSVRTKSVSWLAMVFFICVLLGVLPVLINYWIAQYTPIFRLRYVLFASVFLLLAFSLFWVWISRWNKWVAYLLFGVMMVYILKDFSPYARKIENWRGVQGFVQENLDEETLIVVCAPYKTIDFSYYWDRALFADYKHFDKRIKQEQLFYPVVNLEELKYKGAFDAKRVIFIQSHEQHADPNGTLAAYYEDNYELLNSWGDYLSAQVKVYHKNE